MGSERTKEEILKDKAFTLALLAKVQQANHSDIIGGRLKIQKLAFLVGYKLFQGRLKGLNYTFFTYRWGPFTKDLYETEADFEEADLLERRGHDYSLTERGLSVGLDIYESLWNDEDNHIILEILDSVVDNYATWSTERLIDFTHEVRVRPVGWHEKDILLNLPYHLELTRVLDDEEATAILEFERGLLDSFALLLSKSSKKAQTLSVF